MIQLKENLFAALFNIWDEKAKIYFYDKNDQLITIINAVDSHSCKQSLMEEIVEKTDLGNHKISIKFKNLTIREIEMK